MLDVLLYKYWLIKITFSTLLRQQQFRHNSYLFFNSSKIYKNELPIHYNKKKIKNTELG